MTEADQILDLTRRAIDSFDHPGRSLTSVVRQAHRIAVRRHDFAAQAWLLMQLSDIVVGTSTAELVDIRRKLEAFLGEEAGSAEYVRQTRRYFASRRADDADNINGHSVEQLEDALAQTEAVYGQYSAAPRWNDRN
ncbi:hypothetical protein ACFTS5_12945 [Nocardia sp. NPDC056952]|uniref:hypothetical protein n=1 Tax=Nocardia sp. NPDC056952 TaxID=3345979 RepID=UPI0036366B76